MRNFAFIFLCLLAFAGNAQEVLMPVIHNPLLSNTKVFARSAADTLSLPFTEDFSVLTLHPDTAKWLDQDVIVNADLPIDPPSLGVASFDGLDLYGNAYDFSGSSGWADALTSKPFDLEYAKSDSVYLSFYVQLGGRGNNPEIGDSLVLEFTNPDTNWIQVWSMKGRGSSSGFEWFTLGIQDSIWLQKGFQFRFRNFGSLAGALDHFHLDYIRLAPGRTSADSLIDDVAFIHRPSALFERGLREVPWRHFRTKQGYFFQDTLFSEFVNRSVDIKNVDFRFGLFAQDMTQLYLHPAASDNVNPGQIYGRNYLASLNIPDPDQRRFDLLLDFYLNTQPDINAFNDTLREHLVLNEHYAYDDGTSEASYGLQGSFTKLAHQFELPPNFSDTLTGISIHFAQAVNNTNGKAFRIRVYEDKNGVPGNEVFSSDSVYLVQNKNHVYGFTYYDLDTVLIVSGTYYIGMEQVGSDPLGIGFDRNTDASDRIRIDLGTGWLTSLQTGSLMMRPVFGSIGKTLSVDESLNEPDFILYPNPGNAWVRVNLDGNIELRVINALGSLVAQSQGKEINLSHVSSGYYFIEVIRNGVSLGRKPWVKIP